MPKIILAMNVTVSRN